MSIFHRVTLIDNFSLESFSLEYTHIQNVFGASERACVRERERKRERRREREKDRERERERERVSSLSLQSLS